MSTPPNRDPEAEHRAAAHELVDRLVAHVKATQTPVEGSLLRVKAVGKPGPHQRVVWYARGAPSCRIRAGMILAKHPHERAILARKIFVD